MTGPSTSPLENRLDANLPRPPRLRLHCQAFQVYKRPYKHHYTEELATCVSSTITLISRHNLRSQQEAFSFSHLGWFVIHAGLLLATNPTCHHINSHFLHIINIFKWTDQEKLERNPSWSCEFHYFLIYWKKKQLTTIWPALSSHFNIEQPVTYVASACGSPFYWAKLSALGYSTENKRTNTALHSLAWATWHDSQYERAKKNKHGTT